MTSDTTGKIEKHKTKPGIFYGYIIALCAFIILAISFGSNYSFGVFFNSLMADLGWSRSVTSSGYALGIFLSGILGIFGGRLSDKFGPRIVVIACIIVLALGYFLMSQATQLWQFYIFYGVLIGNAFAVPYIPLASTVSRWFVKYRGLMVGIVISGVGVGTIVMPIVNNILLTAYNWRTSFIVLGIMVLVIATPAAIFLKRDPRKVGMPALGENETISQKLQSRETGSTFREAIRSRSLWLIVSMYFLYGIHVQGMMVHIVPYAKSLGVGDSAAALALSCIGLGNIGGKIGLGALNDRIGVKYTLMFGLSIILLCFIWLLSADSLWEIYQICGRHSITIVEPRLYRLYWPIMA